MDDILHRFFDQNPALWGQLAGRLGEQDVINDLIELIADNFGCQDEWRKLVAIEALIARACGKNLAPEIAENFGDVRPFVGSDATLRELICKELAVACCPMKVSGSDGKEPRAMWAALFVVKGENLPKDSRETLPDFGQSGIVTPENIGIYLWESLSIMDLNRGGLSWTLAAHLALKALEVGDCGERHSLAVEWMSTGVVNAGNQVTEIDGLKEKFTTRPKCKWLIPPANKSSADSIPGFPIKPKTILTPARVVDAWHAVTGKCWTHGGATPMPRNVAVLHSFVSPGWKVIMRLVLLCRPEKVVLWHDDSEAITSIANGLKTLIGKSGTHVNVELKSLGSNPDVATVQDKLRIQLEDDTKGNDDVIFNFTGGTRMMGVAALYLAPLYPQMKLLYRAEATGMLKGIVHGGTFPEESDVPEPADLGCQVKEALDMLSMKKRATPDQDKTPNGMAEIMLEVFDGEIKFNELMKVAYQCHYA